MASPCERESQLRADIISSWPLKYGGTLVVFGKGMGPYIGVETLSPSYCEHPKSEAPVASIHSLNTWSMITPAHISFS